MLIATAITTQVQSSTIPGGAGPSGGSKGGPPGGGGGGPPGGGGGGGAPGGGNANQPAQGNRKPMGALPTIFEGDRSKAEAPYGCQVLVSLTAQFQFWSSPEVTTVTGMSNVT